MTVNFQPTLARLLTIGALTGILCLTGVSAANAAQAPDAIRAYNQGIEAYTEGHVTDALKKFAHAVALDPGYGDAYYNMGSIYYQMKRYEDARDMFQKSVNLNPGDSQAKYNLALSLEKLTQYQEAINVLAQVPPNDPHAAQARQKMDELRPMLAKGPSDRIDPSRPMPAASATAKPGAKPAVAPGGPQPVRSGNLPAQPGTPVTKATLQGFSKGFDGPTGIAIGPGGFMYVANYSKNQIFRVGANGEKSLFSSGENLKGPIGLVYNPHTNELYVANYLLGNVVRINAAGKSSVLVGGLGKPYGLYLDAVNNVLYVSEQESNVISRIVLPQ